MSYPLSLPLKKPWLRLLAVMKECYWPLLIFLILLLQVKLGIKLAAIGACLIFYRPRLTIQEPIAKSMGWFYLSMIALALLNFFRNEINLSWLFLSCMAIGLWALAYLSLNQISFFKRQVDPARIHLTIILFLVLNLAVTFAEYLRIIIETGHLNPYLYQGQYQKYFMNTGDYLKGITQDTSTTNAAINVLGFIWCFHRRQMGMALACFGGVLITGSNLTNLLLLPALIWLFFESGAAWRSYVVICLGMMAIFYSRVSPQNLSYLVASFSPATAQHLHPTAKQDKQDDSLKLMRIKDWNEAYQIAAVANPTSTMHNRPGMPDDPIHTAAFQRKDPARQDSMAFATLGLCDTVTATKEPHGKLLGLRNAWRYMIRTPSVMLSGCGAGHYSSRLAFKATGLGIYGHYPQRFQVMDPRFREQQLSVFAHFYQQPDKKHSIIEYPNNSWVQLGTEYGLLGLLAFLFFYGKSVLKTLPFSKLAPYLLFTGGLLFMDYWFEQISVLPFLELLILPNLKRT